MWGILRYQLPLYQGLTKWTLVSNGLTAQSGRTVIFSDWPISAIHQVTLRDLKDVPEAEETQFVRSEGLLYKPLRKVEWWNCDCRYLDQL